MGDILGQRLEKGPLLCAEGFLFELERRGYLKAGPFVPEVVLDHPESLRELHREFLRAGSDVMVAFTYYAHRDKMRVVGRERDIEELNRQALRIAKQVASEGNALTAGNICNTWVYDPKVKESWDEVYWMYDEQVRWAKEEGADYIIAETLFYTGEALIALEVIKKYGFEAVITFAPFHEKTLDGDTYEDACRKLKENGADVVGLNCGRGPDTMFPLLENIRNNVEGEVAALPVPYRTTIDAPTFQKLKTYNGEQAFPVLLDPFFLNRKETANFAVKAWEKGINYIGLCCGGAPHFIRAMAEALGRDPPASRYSPDLSLHAMLCSNVKEHNLPFKNDWQ
ncbi:MAG: homocysteine S-methyltransferase family protein [Candidatus Nanoarchaeia archaeon]